MNTKISCECGRSIFVSSLDEAAECAPGWIRASAEIMGWKADPAKTGVFRCRACSHAASAAAGAPSASYDELEDGLCDLLSAALRMAEPGSGIEEFDELSRARARIHDLVTAREQIAAGEAATELLETFAARARVYKANAEFLLASGQKRAS